MTSKEKIYSAFKWLLIAAILVAAFSAVIAKADQVFLVQQYSKSNQSFIQIVNKTKYDLYCIIESEGYFRDFTLYSNRSSRWYIEPYGHYEWSCK